MVGYRTRTLRAYVFAHFASRRRSELKRNAHKKDFMARSSISQKGISPRAVNHGDKNLCPLKLRNCPHDRQLDMHPQRHKRHESMHKLIPEGDSREPSKTHLKKLSSSRVVKGHPILIANTAKAELERLNLSNSP